MENQDRTLGRATKKVKKQSETKQINVYLPRQRHYLIARW